MKNEKQSREVKTPGDFREALSSAGLLKDFQKLAYSHQREHVEAIESAKKPETRAARIEKALKMIGEKSRQ